MKRNKLSLFLVALASGFLLCQNAGAYATWTEEFVGYNTGRMGTPTSGASGGFPTWQNDIPSITVTNGSGSLNGIPLGLVQSYGDMCHIEPTNNLNNGEVNLWVNKGPYPQSPETNVYYSFLYRIDDISTVSSVGQQLIGVNRENSDFFKSASTIHWVLEARNTGSAVQLGISKYQGITNWASHSVSAGETFFVVVRQHILVNAIFDEEYLWIDPPGSTFGTNANMPAASCMVNDVGEDQSTTGPGRFWVLTSGQQADIDEIRVANTWGDVTPWVGQCNSNLFLINPSNTTIVEGMGVRMPTISVGTGPSYQWQVSHDGGSTWTDVAGATDQAYTTPNLWVSSDNQVKYRVKAHTACNGLDVLSLPATITVIAPTVTGTGLIMDDNFSDSQRAGLGGVPVPTTESVWYTAPPSGNLDASSGALVGLTVAGTSTMYLGYFLKEANGTNGYSQPTNLPVHLGVTNKMRVTLKWQPNDFGSGFTNNGDLRFGLYDYDDGALLVTADSAAVQGSAGQGVNVRGYMLNVDFGTNFTANTPMQISARTALGDANLAGSTGDYFSLGSGPYKGGYSNLTSFADGTVYTLLFDVERVDTNACRVTTTITNAAGTNWNWTAVDTNYAYHRFDAFAMRNTKAENAPVNFTISEFKVEVIPTPWQCYAIALNGIVRTDATHVTLSWSPSPTPSEHAFTYSVYRKLDPLSATWTLKQSGISGLTYTDNSASASSALYLVTSP